MNFIHLTKQGFLDLLQLFIILNNKFNYSNNLLSQILLYMAQLRNSSYIVFSHFAKQSKHNQIYQIISYFARPQLIAYQKYLFFASFGIVLLIYFTLIYQVVAYQLTRKQKIKEKNSLQQFLFFQKGLVQVTNIVISFIYVNYEFNIMNFLFEISLVEFGSHETFYQGIIIIQLLLYTLFASTKLIINQQKLSFSSNISAKFFFTNLEVTLHVMNYVQIFSYCFAENSQLLQTIISLLISIIQMINICKNYHFMNQKAYRIVIFCQSYALILSISELVVYFTSYSQSDLGIFSFISFPLLLAVINEYHQQSMIQNLYDPNSSNLAKFQLLFSNLKNQQQTRQKCYELFIYKAHMKLCQQCACPEKVIINDVYLNLIEDHVSQKHLKDQSTIIYILVLLFTENYIQAYSICSSILENHYQLNNDHLSIKYLMKNSSGAIIQSLSQKDSDQRLCHAIYSLIIGYLQQESKYLVKSRLKSSNSTCDLAMHAFEDYYKTEYRIRLLNMEISKLLMMKQNLHRQIIRKQNKDQIFDISYNVAQKLLTTQKNIDELYKENPSNFKHIFLAISVINLRVFYQTEILNNYLQASKDHSIVFEMDVLRSKNILYLIHDNKATFLITKLHHCSYNIEIERAASNASEYFQSEIPRYIEPLIPKAIRDYHGENLHEFFSTGNSPRYKQTSRIFILQNNFIQIAESYLDTYEIQQDLKFINIIQDVKDIKGYMILNNKYEITGMNRNFLGLLNYSKQQIEAFKPQDIILGLNINYIIPTFSLIVNDQRHITQIECFFPKQSSLSQSSRAFLSERFTNTDQLDRYESLIEIEQKYHHNEMAYIIITFDYFKKLYSTSLTSNFFDQSIRTVQIPQLLCFTHKLEEDIQLEPPYDFISSENQRQEVVPMFTLKYLHSPLLLEKSSTYEVGTQQRFFQRNDEQEMDSEEVSLHKKGLRQQTTVLYQKLDTKRDESKIDVATPKIQRKNENRSDYLEKLVFVDKIANKKINNTNIRFAVCFLIFTSVLGVVSLLIQTLLIQNNFSYYIDDVNHLQIKSDLIQPLLSFYVLRFIIYDKMTQLHTDEMTLEDYNTQTLFAFQNIQPQYQLFHDNVAKFFLSNDLQIEVMTYYENIKIYIDSGEYEYVNMSTRTFIMQLLEYQQFIYIIYASNTIPILNGCVQFQFMNYNKLIKLGNYLKQTVYNDTLQRNTSQIEDQILIIVCFLSVNFICLLFSYHYFRKFAKQKQQIGSLLLNIDDRAFQLEIEYCQYLIDELGHSSISQYYSYSEKSKIQQIKDMDVNAKQEHQQTKFQNQAAYIPTSKFLLYIYTMFIAFLGINLANTLILSEFISRYEPTAQLYQNTSDLCVSLSIIFAFREILNNKVFYKYLVQSDFEYFYDEIEVSLSQIQNFSQVLLDQSNWNTLFNSYFLDFFLNQQTNNLCPLINSDNLTNIEAICETAMGGTLKMGLQSVVNYITKSFITDEAEFNYTLTRRSTNYVEIEGSFLFTEYLRKAGDMAMADFSSEVLHYQSILESILITAIIVTFMLIAIIIFVLQMQLKPQLEIASKFIHLIPRSVLFLDNAFERRAKLAFLNDP